MFVFRGNVQAAVVAAIDNSEPVRSNPLDIA
jgi:hypothetical protein